MSIFRNHLPLMGAAGSGDVAYNIRQSIRFDEGNNAYMHRTPSGASNRRTWTWSGWLKHSGTSANGYHNVWSVRSDNNNFFEIAKRVTDTGENHYDITNMTSSTRDIRLISSAEFRDPSAWYHFVFVVDTTQAQAANRVRFFVNGERITNFSTETYPSLNLETFINTTNKHEIGAYNGGSGYMMDGYMADIHFIDGYAYGPEYFGEFKEDTDIWTPIRYTGSFGTNGYYLKGQNASALGDDSSGNNNDFTTSGMAAHDQIKDSPTHNFATYNSIGANDTYSSSTVGLTNGNLEFDSNGGSSLKVVGLTIDNVMLDGYKWYFEIALTGSSFNTTIGFRNANNGDDTPSVEIESDGQIKKDSGNVGSATGGFSAGDIIGIRLDWTNTSSRKISFYKNNTLVTGEQTFSTVGYEPVGFMFYARESGSGVHHLNMGQNGTFNGNKTAQGNSDANGVGDFYYAVPSGHFAITHQNLNAVS